MLAVIGFGERSKSRSYSRHDIQIVASLVQMCAGILENSQTHQTLEFLNRQLTLKIYQLNTLFELSKDFSAVWDSEAIFRILGTSLIGQLLISRCAVFTFLNDTLQLQFVRGFRLQDSDLDCLRALNLKSFFSADGTPVYCSNIPNSELLEFCSANKIHLLFPLVLNEEVRGMILLGDRKNRKPFGQEEYDFINTLGNLAVVADENARMQHAMIEKERMERELAIARDIQVSLLPSEAPRIEGYEIASVFHPCYSVAGDYFDFLPVSDHETAIAIGDVSGKSTPAALIMVRLQASLRTLASIEVTDPHITLQKLNRLLCDRQSNKYVTFFYGVLNHRDHTLHYVNAGHCYPLIVKKNGSVDRLETGGTVLGFFKDIQYRNATYSL
ncbi:MAG TPA: SpoIIE family protein phosphatase, partial [Acidobacteriota bacterium]|nr:SpoIIE family protein phosphatase [Acidobacteriota bacterium]